MRPAPIRLLWKLPQIFLVKKHLRIRHVKKPILRCLSGKHVLGVAQVISEITGARRFASNSVTPALNILDSLGNRILRQPRLKMPMPMQLSSCHPRHLS